MNNYGKKLEKLLVVTTPLQKKEREITIASISTTTYPIYDLMSCKNSNDVKKHDLEYFMSNGERPFVPSEDNTYQAFTCYNK